MNMASTIPLEPVRAEPLSLPTSTRVPVFPNEADPGGDSSGELRQGPRGEGPSDAAPRSPRRGLQQYLSRFDEAMKLRSQLVSEEPRQQDGSGAEQLDAFRVFRLAGSVLLALAVRAFVCKYLVSVFRGASFGSSAEVQAGEGRGTGRCSGSASALPHWYIDNDLSNTGVLMTCLCHWHSSCGAEPVAIGTNPVCPPVWQSQPRQCVTVPGC